MGVNEEYIACQTIHIRQRGKVTAFIALCLEFEERWWGAIVDLNLEHLLEVSEFVLDGLIVVLTSMTKGVPSTKKLIQYQTDLQRAVTLSNMEVLN